MPTTKIGATLDPTTKKLEADQVPAGFAPLASPTFTGTPAVPTASPGTNTTQVASTAFVAAAITALIASSPSALDTLNELAAALGNDANFATTVTNALAAKASKTPPVGSSLGTTGTIDLDLSTLNDTYQTITLTGNPTFTTSNRAAGRSVILKLKAGGSSRTITWPAWIPLGAALPTTLAAGKTAVVSVTFWDTTDAEATAAYAAQP